MGVVFPDLDTTELQTTKREAAHPQCFAATPRGDPNRSPARSVWGGDPPYVPLKGGPCLFSVGATIAHFVFPQLMPKRDWQCIQRLPTLFGTWPCNFSNPKVTYWNTQAEGRLVWSAMEAGRYQESLRMPRGDSSHLVDSHRIVKLSVW